MNRVIHRNSRDQRTSSGDTVDEAVEKATTAAQSVTADADIEYIELTQTGDLTDDSVETSSAASDSVVDAGAARRTWWRKVRWRRLVVIGVLPLVAMVLTAGSAYGKWRLYSEQATQSARIESVQAASDSTTKILSYSPDTVDRDLDSAADRLTGHFRASYTKLTHDVVIPGAKQQKISAVASVPAAGCVWATPTHAVVMVFVNQAITVGNDAPSSTNSTVRVTLDKDRGRWLISEFDPI